MKQLHKYLLLSIILLIAVAYCLGKFFKPKTRQDNIEYKFNIPLNIENDWELIPEEEMSYTYMNSVKGHSENDMICGSFLEGRNDTLYVEKTQKEYTFNVVSSNPKIPALKLKNTICPSLVYEGDLDGNGTTEVGILDTWHTSSCRLYRIYTLKNNKWYYLLPPLETSESVRASGVELAEPSGERDKVRVRYADFEAPLSCCASSPIKDTIVTALFLPISY